ncbi:MULTISPECIES: ABC transporter permease [Brenneria]|uniref:ABC transporter permease n=1 Tax=Brenneria nigrifluens DSM 30175 = ATCC 13028 TaxID=1121120 RepID=A0A2U1UW29_9GAMM|nr:MULTISPECIES: ABC transporter permease [Brenneria]EHD22786.1 ABC-type transporter, integral membrane subunit [Brenneria sp. EniD312]PWC25857.1 ABC transporter permease [Brenneria nigrifluens] [Brenneria nigrifluens DSM 30175 = ATCC 13028]QCR05760.1 ABC transporter permease [Brenneria nigrifluens] [Brenneria nigrifluens DSM 30175 = ATCC 13028]
MNSSEVNSRPRLVDDANEWDDDATRPEIWRARLAHAIGLLIRRPGLGMAILFILFVIAAAVFPGWFTSHDPFATSPANKILPPSWEHLFGTDHVGRDLFTRVLYGSKLTIQATALAILIAAVVGLLLGIFSGFSGGKVDAALMRIVDVTLAIPSLLLALAIVTAIGFGTLQVAIAVGVGSIPAFARTTRSEVLKVKALPFVEAARLCGAGWLMIVWRHILPNSCAPVAVLIILEFGGAVLAVAALSFLGFGAQPPAAEWGTLISEGRGYLMTAPWVSLLPGLFVALVVFSLNHIAKTLEELQR